MGALKIPSTFQLMGKTYTVHVISKDDWEDAEVWGDFCTSTCRIRVLKHQNPETTEQTFYHELVHAILTSMNHRLNKNETFVDQFGSLLQQVMKTSK